MVISWKFPYYCCDCLKQLLHVEFRKCSNDVVSSVRRCTVVGNKVPECQDLIRSDLSAQRSDSSQRMGYAGLQNPSPITPSLLVVPWALTHSTTPLKKIPPFPNSIESQARKKSPTLHPCIYVHGVALLFSSLLSSPLHPPFSSLHSSIYTTVNERNSFAPTVTLLVFSRTSIKLSHQPPLHTPSSLRV